jgi:GT2 family glycosyltransferase
MSTGYSAVVATFRRPEALRVTLTSLMSQRPRPNFVVVADNDPGHSAAPVIADESWAIPVVNLPMPRNLGPAGGWGSALRCAADRRDRGEWVLVLDDDDPIQHPDIVGRLLAVAGGVDAAAVGLRGATVSWPLGLLRRVGGAAQPADYLASNGLPLYRWAALDAVGGFDDSLFFGFEDLDLGLRLRAGGWSLLAVEVGIEVNVADTNPVRTPWREYYKSRALVAIARRHLGPVVTAFTIARLGLGALRLLVGHGPESTLARFAGVADGIAGRLGVHRYDPEDNPAKSPL